MCGKLTAIYPFHIGVRTYQLSWHNLVILTSKRSMSLYKWSSNASLSFSTSTISSMQDILCDTGNLAWHPIEAGKIININEHQSLRSLKNIDSIEVKTKYLPYTFCQLQHITAYRYFLLLYYSMPR